MQFHQESAAHPMCLLRTGFSNWQLAPELAAGDLSEGSPQLYLLFGLQGQRIILTKIFGS